MSIKSIIHNLQDCDVDLLKKIVDETVLTDNGYLVGINASNGTNAMTIDLLNRINDLLSEVI